MIKIENKDLYKELNRLENQLRECSKREEYLKKRIEIAEKHTLDSSKKIVLSGLKALLEDKKD